MYRLASPLVLPPASLFYVRLGGAAVFQFSPLGPLLGLFGTPKRNLTFKGITDSGSVDTGVLPTDLNGGSFYATQLISPTLEVTLTDGTVDHRTDKGATDLLDKGIGMVSNTPGGNGGRYPADGAPADFVDSPIVPLMNPMYVVYRADTFHDYLMFTLQTSPALVPINPDGETANQAAHSEDWSM